jgi:hypothetical protein
MINFEYNRDSSHEGVAPQGNFCNENIFILSKSSDDLETFEDSFGEFGFSSQHFDISNIPENKNKKSILLISDDMLSKLDAEVYTSRVIKNHFVYTYSDNTVKSEDLSRDGHLVLPIERSDILNLLSICKTKASFEKDITDLEEHKSKLMKMTSLGQYTSTLVRDLNNYNTICMTSLDGLRLINDRTHKDKKIDFLVSKGIKGSQMINSLSRKYRKFLYSTEETISEFFNMNLMLTETLEFINKEIVTNKIEVKNTVPKDLFIYCSEVSFIQILMNLLANAIYAIKDLETKWIEISIVISKKGATLLVKDSGFGVAPEIAERMFEPLFTTKKPNRSNGLGLSFCDTEATQMGMTLVYIKAKNTVFGIHIPKNKLKVSMIN